MPETIQLAQPKKYGLPHIEERIASEAAVAAIMAKSPAKKAAPVAANDNVPPSTMPVDPWMQRHNPSLPLGILPALIEDFALSQAEIMGVDPSGLAAAAIAVCAAATPDSITLRMKKHDDWEESAPLDSPCRKPQCQEVSDHFSCYTSAAVDGR